MSHVFPRHTKAQMPIAVKGDGPYIVDAEGKRYLDGSGGAAVSCLGHSDPDVVAAIQKQAAEISFAHTGFFSSKPAESLADRLVTHAPEGIDRVYLVSGGSEAVESALKLARQYMIEIGNGLSPLRYGRFLFFFQLAQLAEINNIFLNYLWDQQQIHVQC